MMSEWICEEAFFGKAGGRPNYSLGILSNEILDYENDVFIYNTKGFGKIMLIKDIIQITEKDYQNYVSGFTKIIKASKEKQKNSNILVIGGGDGSIINTLINMGYRNIDWVEINESVKKMAKKHFGFYPTNTHETNLNEYIQDGFEFVQKSEKYYDIILVDIEEDVKIENIYSNEFYRNCSKILNNSGVFVINILPGHVYSNHYKCNYSLIKNNFTLSYVNAISVPIPSYCFGVMSFIFASPQQLNKSYIKQENIWEDNYQISRRQEIFDWHCENFYNWKDSLKEEELDAINYCISLGREPYLYGFLSNFSFSHRVYGSKPIAHRISFGTANFGNNFTSYINRIAKKRNINLYKAFNNNFIQEFNGIAFDSSTSEIKFYALVPKEKLKDIFPDLYEVDFELKNIIVNQKGCGIVSVSISDNIVLERKIYYVSDIVTAMVTNKRGVVLQYNANNNREPWYEKINEKGKEIVDTYKNKFNIDLDTVNFSSHHNYTIYFENE